jgi:hypothetical protein
VTARRHFFKFPGTRRELGPIYPDLFAAWGSKAAACLKTGLRHGGGRSTLPYEGKTVPGAPRPALGRGAPSTDDNLLDLNRFTWGWVSITLRYYLLSCSANRPLFNGSRERLRSHICELMCG